uniref:Uncharacterized protein n=1 Tax=Scinaia undulata TaxID=1884664 RepID=A0A1G4NY04_9FLOR|nr:Hypothetical protein ORF_5 [Scinaia undulata]SCW23379.1 Hypothetical protein ORF_5 [Scinaia undulata]
MIYTQELNFFQKNIYFPRTYCHHVSTVFKIRCFCWYFMFLSLSSTRLIIINIAIGSIMLLNQRIQFKIFNRKKKNIFMYFLGCLCIYSFLHSYCIFNACKLLYNLKIQTFPSFCHISEGPQSRLPGIVYREQSKFISAWLMSPLIRGYAILISYFIAYNAIMLTTASQCILVKSSNYLQYYPLAEYNRAKISFIIFLAYEFMCNLEIKCKDIIGSIRLQGLDGQSNTLEIYYRLLILLFHGVVDYIRSEIAYCTNAIYLRELTTASSDILSYY